MGFYPRRGSGKDTTACAPNAWRSLAHASDGKVSLERDAFCLIYIHFAVVMGSKLLVFLHYGLA